MSSEISNETLREVNDSLREQIKQLKGLIKDEGIPEERLKQLAVYYGGPVAPVKEYCDAFYAWVKAISERAKEEEETDPLPEGYTLRRWMDDPPPVPGRYISTYYREIDAACKRLLLPISKSNMLGRLIYGGERLRTVKCPEHKGHWVGLEWPEGWGGPRCEHGCQLTGWLPAD